MDLKENLMRIKDNLLLIPEERFDSLTQDSGYGTSFIYLVACLVISLPVEMILTSISEGLLIALISVPIALIISLPVAYLIYGIQHLFLRLVGGQGTFLQSVQVFIYGSTVSLIFGSIPLVGTLLSLLVLANVVLGSKRVHKISIWRALLALIALPLLLAIIIVLVVIVVFGMSNLAGVF